MECMQAYGQTKLIQQTLQQHLELGTQKTGEGQYRDTDGWREVEM